MIRQLGAGVVALAAASAVIAGCSSSAPSTGAQPHSTSAATTTHWWTSTDYCSILRQTVRAGHSVLAGTAATDPKLLATTKTFVSDVTASAPSEVRAQWQVLGPALTQLVESGGKLATISGVNTREVSAAATAIASDAKTRCHVDVSA
jgi:hypothetical protein